MLESKPLVCVLMSSYNGEKYIQQQLDSILSQENVDVKLVIRDDGSTDGTKEIIRKYSSVQMIDGENIGCEPSFMELLHQKIEADYYAFADQDDVWHPRKLISAIENIKQYNCDLSVCNLMLVDNGQNEIGPLFSISDVENYEKLMKRYAQTNFHGCVQVWTKRLHKIIQSSYPFVIEPHDVWVNAVANVVSSTYVDNHCYINYRLHGNNVSGYTTSTKEKFKKRIKLYFGKNHPCRDTLCKQILENFGSYLEKDDSRFITLNLIANYKKSICHKLKLCFSSYFRSMTLQNRVIWTFCVMLNKY